MQKVQKLTVLFCWIQVTRGWITKVPKTRTQFICRSKPRPPPWRLSWSLPVALSPSVVQLLYIILLSWVTSSSPPFFLFIAVFLQVFYLASSLSCFCFFLTAYVLDIHYQHNLIHTAHFKISFFLFKINSQFKFCLFIGNHHAKAGQEKWNVLKLQTNLHNFRLNWGYYFDENMYRRPFRLSKLNPALI